MAKYNGKYDNYKFKIKWDSSRQMNPLDEAIDVVLTTKDGEEYRANFVTKNFLDHMFEKNKVTGECAKGTYFCMPDNMVVIEEINDKNLKATIDDLIENLEVDDYFKKFD